MMRRTMNILVLAGGATVTCLLLGCASAQIPGPAAKPHSGIEGRTMVDGGCPMTRDASPCPDKPLASRLTVVKADSAQIVAEATSDDNGYFRIPLPPGHYVLHPANLTGSVVPIAQPLTITVIADRFASITISFDSGIR